MFGKNIGILYRQLNLFLSHELEGTGFTATELMYLESLYKNDGVTQDDLVKEYCINKAATARTIQGMEKKGLVERMQDDGDKRAKKVFLTEKAYQFQDLIEQIQKKWILAMNMNIREEELEVFAKVFTDMVEKAKQLNEL